jgi:hypothetical protein
MQTAPPVIEMWAYPVTDQLPDGGHAHGFRLTVIGRENDGQGPWLTHLDWPGDAEPLTTVHVGIDIHDVRLMPNWPRIEEVLRELYPGVLLRRTNNPCPVQRRLRTDDLPPGEDPPLLFEYRAILTCSDPGCATTPQ